MAGSVTVSRTSPPPAFSISSERAPVRAEKAAERLRQFAELGQCLLQIVPRGCRTSTELPRITGAPVRPMRASRRTCGRRPAAPRASAGAHRWRRPRAGYASRPADRGRARCGAAPMPATLDRALGKEVRDREQAHDERREQDRRRFPLRNIEHGSTVPLHASPRPQLELLVLDRLALGAHARHHRAHLPHPYPVGDLDLDLFVVDHFGDLADQPPEVITVSPRRKFLISSWCSFARFCCGRRIRKYMITKISTNGSSCISICRRRQTGSPGRKRASRTCIRPLCPGAAPCAAPLAAH